MKKPIICSILKTLRERQKDSSQTALADAAGISKDTLWRIEHGKQSGSTVLDLLAKALGVEPEVLTGEKPLPDDKSDPDAWLETRRHKLSYRVDGAVRNAFSLVSLRYKIPVARIVELAPLLFVLAAEESLERRRRKLATLTDALDQADEAAADFHHLSKRVLVSHRPHDDIAAEESSIDAADILGLQLDGDLMGETLKDDYDYERDNPFVASLREAARDPRKAEITRFSRDDADFRVCRDEALKLAGGNVDLALGFLEGWALLRDMPRELRKKDALEQRLAWLREKQAEHAKAGADMLAALGLDDLEVGEAP